MFMIYMVLYRHRFQMYLSQSHWYRPFNMKTLIQSRSCGLVVFWTILTGMIPNYLYCLLFIFNRHYIGCIVNYHKVWCAYWNKSHFSKRWMGYFNCNQNSSIDIPELDLNGINLFVSHVNLDFLIIEIHFLFSLSGIIQTSKLIYHNDLN